MNDGVFVFVFSLRTKFQSNLTSKLLIGFSSGRMNGNERQNICNQKI